ncbi:MAG TPA: cytochrome c-type biogenesis protein [Burkholderiales bacterium]|nr:cytochrome c-type biogenesis protein [Burkholderiales bacterium]
MTRTIGFVLVCLCLLVSGLNAQESSLRTQERTRQLEEKLRCLVCQNQTLADSNAELAGDLRKQVAEQMAAGKSDEQIIEYLTARYGDFVLYDPPFKLRTALLWVGPFALLALGAAALVLVLRRRRAAPEEAPLAPDEKRVVERVLGPAKGDGVPR